MMKLILVIEDETPIRMNIQETLALANFSVITANNGINGLRLAKDKLPDLIICDILMPDMNGFEVLQGLRGDAYTANIPLIFLSAKTEYKDAREGMNLGADDYITKPFQTREIIQAVKARLARQEQMAKHYLVKYHNTEKLSTELEQTQKNLDIARRLCEIKDNLLDKLSQELRDTLATINMALCMLQHTGSEGQRRQYLDIIREEYRREVKLLNEVDRLREILTVENTKLLQEFKILNKNP